jgi:hypothetical protein
VRRKRTILDVRARDSACWQILFLGCLAAALLFLGTPVSEGGQSIEPEGLSSSSDIVAEVSGTGRIRLQASFHQPHIHRTEIDGRPFQEVLLAGEGVTAEVGKPKLPVVRRLVEIPLGATIRLGEVSATIEELPLAELGFPDPILPLQPPVPKIPGAAERASLVIDEQHYRTDAMWPSELVRVREVGIWRQMHLALVEIFPVRYNPHRQVINLCTEVQCDLILQGGDPVLTEKHRRRYANPFTNRWNASDLFITTKQPLWSRDGSSETPVVYLMVVVDDLYGATLPLADWKRQEGFEVVLVKTSETGYDRENIKDCIRDAYENWEQPPTFLLLVGDSDQIPPFSMGGITSDLYYSTMSPGDYFPDIQVGRLAVADSSELAGVVRKIIDHEMALWTNDDKWTRRGYFMASNDSWYHDVAESTQSHCMRLARANGMVCDSLYEYYHSGTPISTALNDGRSMAIYSGHGSWSSWQGPAFVQNDIEALQNGQMYPLVCSHACNTGGFHRPVCFGETWLRTPSRGAAAFWGSSVSSYWYEDDVLQRAMFEALFDSSLTWLSGMMDQAKLELWIHYGGGGLSESYYRQYNLLGDPAMYLWTRPPRTLVVEYDQQVPIGSADLSVTVLEPRPDRASAQDVFKSTVLEPVDDALVSVIIGESRRGLAKTMEGSTSVALNPILIREEALEVAVSKLGYRPFVGMAEVKADGPYLIYAEHFLDDTSDGNGDGQVNIGETVRMTVAVENTGSEKASEVTALLSEEDPYIQLDQSTADFGDIDAKGTSWGFPPYEFHVSELCSSGHVIDYTLTITDSSGQQWNSEFEIQVVTPELVYVEHHIQDAPPGGNDDGVAEPGETVDLAVVLENQGLAMANDVWATLTSLDTLVEVLSDSAEFGDLPSAAQATSAPPYQLLIDQEAPSLLFCPLVLDIGMAENSVTTETLTVMVGTPGFSDSMETGPGEWTHMVITQSYIDDWHLSQQRSHSESTSWKCGAVDTGTYGHYEDAGLFMKPILLANNSVLSFWHWIEAEIQDAINAWDGGIVEISDDGGTSWEQVDPVGGYPFVIYDQAPSAGSPLVAGTPCFSGSHDWKLEQFDLSEYGGLVQLRFRFCSDQYTEGEGWYLDDIVVAAAETTTATSFVPSVVLSRDDLVLTWIPADGLKAPVYYEIYGVEDPLLPFDREQPVAVVSEPYCRIDADGFSKSFGAAFYIVIARGAGGRRSSPSKVVGCWRRAVR